MVTQGSPALLAGKTEQTLSGYRRYGRWSLAAGLFIVLLAFIPHAGWTSRLPYLGIPFLAGGLTSVRNVHRMRRTMSTHPWIRCRAEVTPSRRGGPRVSLLDPTTDTLVHLKCTTTGPSRPAAHASLWWSGTPEHGGVLSTPGGDRLTWARPEQRPHHPRRPRYRWILLLGVITCGLGIAGSAAADHDPMIELTVVDGSTAPGPCTVRFKDPLTGGHRTAPFVCEGHRDALIPKLEYGWVVSYGPWKGDLYNAAWDGTPANPLNDGLFVGGALLTLAGGIGGAVSLRARRRYPAPTAGPPRTPLLRRTARASIVLAGRTRRTLRR
ncbi:hypothetical protein ACIREE_28795 [Streptomyces sp. NPDC102467]|uniref:hypothetical protein n=1 Tax=Streptomyces sp. NPDC102467 TaxID=3366179 RepID=UPI00382B6301